jgi:prepilin-type N-terminal cleavage/methylation domain-containing protein
VTFFACGLADRGSWERIEGIAMRNDISSRHPSGFTLIEILSVVIIIGIASAIIVPQIGTRNDLMDAAAARVVMADLIYAQNRAIATQQMTYVDFDVTNHTYSVKTAMPSTYATHPINKTNYIVTFGSGGTRGLENITLYSASFDGQPTLAFDELGTPITYTAGTPATTATMSSGSIVLKCGTYALTITVEPNTGEITVQ